MHAPASPPPLCVACGTRCSSLLMMAGSEIGEDHFGILCAIDHKTAGILTAASQQKAAVGDGLAIRRCIAYLLGTNTILQNWIALVLVVPLVLAALGALLTRARLDRGVSRWRYTGCVETRNHFGLHIAPLRRRLSRVLRKTPTSSTAKAARKDFAGASYTSTSSFSRVCRFGFPAPGWQAQPRMLSRATHAAIMRCLWRGPSPLRLPVCSVIVPPCRHCLMNIASLHVGYLS